MAPSGISGLETALGLSMSLVDEGILTDSQLIEKMALNPARILQIDKGTLRVGTDADVIIVDPAKEFRVEPGKFISKGRNTPFKGWQLRGTPLFTCVRGTIYEW